MTGNGEFDNQVLAKRDTARRRHAMATRILANRVPMSGDTPAFHVWLQMPAGRTIMSLIAKAESLERAFTSCRQVPDAPQPSPPWPFQIAN